MIMVNMGKILKKVPQMEDYLLLYLLPYSMSKI